MKDVFRKRNQTAQDGYNVGVLLNRSVTKGKVGLELEMEGNNLLHGPDMVPKPWLEHADGSLRGNDNAEYVLAKPIEFDDVDKALTVLWDKFTEHKSKLDDSNRTSVHVHLNVQDFHLNRLATLMGIYFTFEEVLTEWCGEHRVGNLFCLRAKDAPAIVSSIRRFIKSDGMMGLPDNLHYSAMNAQALAKFGSLEWRTLRGCSDKQTIIDWVNILRRIYDLSAEFDDPREFCSVFSQQGPLAFFDSVLGPMASVVRQGVSFNSDRIADSMYEGIRMGQDICYCRDWSLYKPTKLQADPFGRDAKKIAKKIALAQAYADTGAQAYNPAQQYEEGPDYDPWDTPHTVTAAQATAPNYPPQSPFPPMQFTSTIFNTEFILNNT